MKRFFYLLKKFPVKLIVLLILFILSVCIFGFIVHEVLWEKEEEFDSLVATFISTHLANDTLTKTLKVITQFASGGFLLSAYSMLTLWYFFYIKNRKLALDIGAIGISGFLVIFLLKDLFRRARPSDPLIAPLTNFSFPSGHASSGFIFYGLLAWLIWNSQIRLTHKYVISISLIIFSVLIGFSRIYLRIHYASDVMAGFCIGFAWLTFSLWFLNKLRRTIL